MQNNMGFKKKTAAIKHNTLINKDEKKTEKY